MTSDRSPLESAKLTASQSMAPRRRARARAYGAAALIVGVCTLLSGLSHWRALTEANIVMIFLAGVAFTAARYGHGPALAAIVLSVVSYDFFFVPPVFAFALVDAQYFITLGVMVAMGLLISELTSRLRAQLHASQQQERRTAQLYRMTQEFGQLTVAQMLLPTAAAVAADTFDGEVALYLCRPHGAVELKHGEGNSLGQDPASAATAQWVAEHNRPAEQGAGATAATFVPMAGLERMVGVLGVRPRQEHRFSDGEERQLLEACANLIALSLERDQSLARARDAQVQAETERIQNSLLTSISHDLRTPLATIGVTASSLLEEPGDQPLAAKRGVVETIVDETRQLGRQVDNLLDLARLNAGAAPLAREWEVLEELVGVALSRLRRELAGHRVSIDIPADFPMLWVAGELLVQVLVNLLENAHRYTPADSRIEIIGRASGDRAEIVVSDDGPGLPPGQEAAVFNKFVRGTTKVADGRRGLGLGLTICRSIVRAHGGKIVGRNRPAGGAEFLITLLCTDKNPRYASDSTPTDAAQAHV